MTGEFLQGAKGVVRGGARALSDDGQPGHYAVLDVDWSATRVEIREAFLRLKSTFGAGSAALYGLIGEDEAKEQLARAEEAFRVLSDDVARRDYDQRMGYTRPFATSKSVDASLASRQGLFTRELAPQMHPGPNAFSSWNDAVAPLAPPVTAARVQTAHEQAYGADPSIIRTSRSVLQVIKLKANKVLGPATGETASKYAEIIAASDPGDGDLYKRLREAADVTEAEIVERTKVSIAYIRAIEGNRFDRLPQAVYVKGFLRSYFRYLALPDPEKLVAAFSARLTEWQTNKKS